MELQISMNVKILLYTFDNSLLFTESIQNTTNLSTLNHNVQFLRVLLGRWHNAIRAGAKTLCASF